MSMDDATWARHANPLSVYSRFTCLPLIVLAIFSRVWLGPWCLIPLALAILWTWLNPRLFNPPKSTDNWASKGVMGERIFLNRKDTPIPKRYHRIAGITTLASVLGMIVLTYGLWILSAPLTLFGLIGAIVPKVIFVHHMVSLFDETPRTGPT